MRYFLDPFGCVKNQVDAENMMSHLNSAGWESSTAENADLIIINSCGFIESAKQESINAVMEWRKFYPQKKILLAGCLAQRYAKELAESLPEADGFFGIENIAQIAETAFSLADQQLPVLASGGFKTGRRPLLSLPGSAYVKISEGCNNRCSYCAIPLIRGSLKSRTIPDILEECKTLLGRGIKELCIVAQDVGSFGIDTEGTARLPELLSEISALEGHFWVRLLYIHPDHFPLSILDIMEKDPRILPYFDIPFQHASETILSAMNRQRTFGSGASKKYLKLIETIREKLADAVIRSTFLLGFPGETEKDFHALLDFQERANLDWLGCFTYSREEGTESFSMKNHVSGKTASKRRQIIEERQISITEKSMDRFINQTLEVLLEEQIDLDACAETENPLPKKNGKTLWLGRLYLQAPEIDGTTVITCNETSNNKLQAGGLYCCRVTARREFNLVADVSL